MNLPIGAARNQMKVILFGQHFAEYVLTLASGFPEFVDVTVCISESNYNEELSSGSRTAFAKIDTVAMQMPGPSQPWQFLKSVLKFRKLIKEVKPDVVHFQEMPKGFSFVCWLLCRHTVRILTVHDVTTHPGGDSRTSPRQEYMKGHIRNSANRLIVHGEELFQQVRKFFPELINRTKIIPHPAFRISEYSEAEINPNELLFFGRISRYKGLAFLLQACILLQERGQPFSLVIAGQGDDFDSNRERLNEIGNLTVLNRRIGPDEVDQLFKKADLVVLPYIEASQSGVAAYALGFGKATVASRIGSIPEMIRDSFNGILVNPGDAVLLADGIQQMLADPLFKKQCASNSRQLAATDYSPKHVARATTTCYTEVLQLPDN